MHVILSSQSQVSFLVCPIGLQVVFYCLHFAVLVVALSKSHLFLSDFAIVLLKNCFNYIILVGKLDSVLCDCLLINIIQQFFILSSSVILCDSFHWLFPLQPFARILQKNE